MSNGVINTPSGAHEHHTDVASGLVSKDKSAYAQKSVELYYEKELLRKNKKSITDNYNSVADEHNNAQYAIQNTETTENLSKNYNTTQVVQQLDRSQVTENSVTQLNQQYRVQMSAQNSDKLSAETDVSERYSNYVKYTDVTESAVKKNAVKLNSNLADKFKSVATGSVKAVSAGASYLAELQSYQNDGGAGEAAAHNLSTFAKSTVTKVDKLTNSRYFKFSGKASDSVKAAKSSGRFVAATSAIKKLGKKGVTAVDNVLVNPIVRVAGDDIGSQAAVKMIETSKDVYKVGKTSVKYGYKATKATYKTGKNAVKYGKKTTQTAYKYTRQAAKTTVKTTTKAAQAATKAAATAAKAVSAVITKIVALIVANPIVLIIALIVLIVVMVILMCSSFMGGATKYASYEGAGNSATMTVNNYSAIYDYTNKAIAQRCLDLFNLQDTWTGFLEYHYEYEIEQDDGTFIESSTYPIADIAPIMAYLSVNYQSYTLNDDIKNEIDNIVHNLYTFNYLIEDCTHTVDHGSGNIETITGEKVTYTVTYHNAAKFFEENGYIDSEKMTAYNAVKSYGDISYFRMYNLFGDKNWHEWISEQYGYSIETKYNFNTEKYEYEMIELDYCTLEYRNKDNETASNLYSPLNGTVTSIVETDDYDKVITIKDSENNLEFTIMADFAESINMLVGQGDTVTAGQHIATRNYQIYIKCKSNGAEISPMLLMEYFQHAA